MKTISLPIDERLAEILAGVDATGSAIVVAAPGAGKTTRVPPALADARRGRSGRVVVVEPRRIAARAAAHRIAEENGWTVGREVGWQIRFERRFGRDTPLVFATEGILVQWLQADPFLDGISTVVFDEFHERALAADLALALARRLRREARPELEIVVMSATLDPQPLAEFLGGAPTIDCPGRLFPVREEWLERPDDRPLARQVAAAARRALAAAEGDLLVFLPGLAEIRRAAEDLTPLAGERDLELVPLHGDLGSAEQDRALAPGARRRIVLATNIAETSLTLDGIRAVVDAGWVRQPRFDPATGLDRLETIRVSRASAAQRAGRAGRQAPGACFKLWTAADELALRPFETPEIRRVDLAGAVLALADWGERDPAGFGWFEAPDPLRLARARRELAELGALADDGAITVLGRRLARLPLPPRLGRLVLEGEARGVAEDVALVAALLAERDPGRLARGTARAHSRSDLLDRLDELDPGAGRSRGASLRSAGDLSGAPTLFRLRDQYLEILRRRPAEGSDDRARSPHPPPAPEDDQRRASQDSAERQRAKSAEPSAASLTSKQPRQAEAEAERTRATAPEPAASSSTEKKPREAKTEAERTRATSTEPILRAIAAAYLDRLCRRREGEPDRALMVGGRGVRLARESAVREAPLFVAVALDAGAAGPAGRPSEGLVRVASAIEPAWIPADRLTDELVLAFDPGRERVVAARRRRFEDLVLDEREVPIDDPSAASALLVAAARERLGDALPLAEPEVVALRARIEFLRRARPELALPAIDAELLTRLLPGLCAGKRSFAELGRAPLAAALLAELPWSARQALERDAPERLALPSGAPARIDYTDPERPVLAARIQQLFGLAETPRLAGGRVPVLLHLLAPNGRPQQVTQDLASFWRSTYGDVRRELAGRYPKHAWPEDPTRPLPERRPRAGGAA
ncbi:MAG: ATP-dependent helicase C-terminal domain-containing protein [Thermoanaerobaculia bacterium]